MHQRKSVTLKKLFNWGVQYIVSTHSRPANIKFGHNLWDDEY